MIKIDLDSRPKRKTYELVGSVEVGGKVGNLACEMYNVLKDFEKCAPEALYMAVDKIVTEHEGE